MAVFQSAPLPTLHTTRAKLPSLRLLTPPHNHSRYEMCATRSLRSRRGVDPQPLQPAKTPGTETTPRSQARPRQPLPGPTRATGKHGRPVVPTKLRPSCRAPDSRLRQQQPPQPQLPSGSREAGRNASYAQVSTCPCKPTPGPALREAIAQEPPATLSTSLDIHPG